MRVYERVASSFSSVAPIPLLQARPQPVCRRGSSTRLLYFSPCPREWRRGEPTVCFVNRPTCFNEVASVRFRLEERKTGTGSDSSWLTRIYRNTIYRLTYPQIRKPHPWKPVRGNELIHRLEQTSSTTFIESSVSNAPSHLPSTRLVSLWLSDRRFVTLFKVH